MSFTLAPEDAEALVHLASLEPIDARRWLQDRPRLARRMLDWPPEIRLEISRLLFLSFPAERREVVRRRRRPGSLLVDQLDGISD